MRNVALFLVCLLLPALLPVTGRAQAPAAPPVVLVKMDQTMGPNAYVWGYLAARK